MISFAVLIQSQLLHYPVLLFKIHIFYSEPGFGIAVLALSPFTAFAVMRMLLVWLDFLILLVLVFPLVFVVLLLSFVIFVAGNLGIGEIQHFLDLWLLLSDNSRLGRNGGNLIEFCEGVRLLDGFGFCFSRLLDLTLEGSTQLLPAHENTRGIDEVGSIEGIVDFASLHREGPIKHVFN